MNPCPVCYDDDPDTLVCENAHTLCDRCYKKMMSDDRSANKNCAECRSPMFVWDNPILNPVRAERVPPREAPLTARILLAISRQAAPRRSERAPNHSRCGICSQEGHNRSTCPHSVARPFVPGPGRRCGVCRVVGHTRGTCPDRAAIQASIARTAVAVAAIEEEWAERERARNIRAVAAQERAAFAAAGALVPDALDDLVEAIEAMVGLQIDLEYDIID